MLDLDERAHGNFCDFVRFQARLDPGNALLDEAGVVAVADRADHPAGALRDQVESFARSGRLGRPR